MIKNRVISANQILFAGPSPASGYNFIDISGKLNNDYTENLNNNNLLQYIDRLIDLNYGIRPERQNIRQLGQRGSICRPVISSPVVDLSFTYYVVGVKNDLRCGLTCNYGRFDYPYSGTPYYSLPVSPVSGLISRDLTQPTGEPYWPCDMRDKRNFYLVTTNTSEEANKTKIGTNWPNKRQSVVPEALNFELSTFGNCYLTNYTTNGAVGQAPTANAQYVCENLSFLLSGSGVQIPAVDNRTRTLLTGIYFNIPQLIDDNSPPILQPGDITISISNTSDSSSIKNLGLVFNNISIQSYGISMGLQRENLDSLGYKLPVDRELSFPVNVGLTFDIVVQDTQSGNLVNLLKKDEDYDLTLKIKNPSNYTTIKNTAGLTALQYDFVNAKLENINWTSPLNTTKMASLSFSTEIDPNDISKGFYISGLLNVDIIGDYIIYDDPDSNNSYYLSWDDDSLALLNLKPVF